MKRRALLASLLTAGLALSPLRAWAQGRSGRRFRIALFPRLYAEERSAFVTALEKRGWREGHDFVLFEEIVSHFAPGRHAELMPQILAAKPHVVVTKGTARALAMHRASNAIPIVMLSSGYPVEAGLAYSLARPGKNVTGNSIYAGSEVFAKYLELLKEAKPATRRVGALWGYVPPVFPRAEIEPVYEALRRASGQLGIAIKIVEVPDLDRLEPGLAEIAAMPPDAMLVTSSFATVESGRRRIMRFVIERRLPTISDSAWPAGDAPAPLLAYGARRADLARQAADYAYRILNGESPGELPIQQPARFELRINLETARIIGLEIPRSMLLRADRLSE